MSNHRGRLPVAEQAPHILQMLLLDKSRRTTIAPGFSPIPAVLAQAEMPAFTKALNQTRDKLHPCLFGMHHIVWFCETDGN